MDPLTPSQSASRPPDPSAMAEFAQKLKNLGPGSGLHPGTIVSIDAGHLFHSPGTGADLSLPSGVATNDTAFAPNLNPAFFYSWDVHPGQPPDWFRVSLRFTPSDFGISEAGSYVIEWVVIPFVFELGSVLTLDASPNPGTGAGNVTLDEFAVRTLRMTAGPVQPNETMHADLIRNSPNGSWIWLRANITLPPPTTKE